MIEIRFSDRFRRSAQALPQSVLKKLARLITLLVDNPYDPRLHTKPLTGPLSGFNSFRITRDWRVIFQFEDPQTVILITVGHRKDIYR